MPVERTHRIEVEGVGSFVFRRRTLKLQAMLEARMERMTGGPVQSPTLSRFCAALATLETLTVEAPEGWDLEEADPLDDDTFGNVAKVWEALREQEETFRRARPGYREPDRLAA
ncbi:MAG TPA: hypothetical protein VGC15_13050 [Acetobacteraceae bacterium]